MRKISTVLDGLSYLECPRWHEDRIWVSDFYTHHVLSAREDGSDLRVEAEVPGQPSGLGWLPDGRLLLISQRAGRRLRRSPTRSPAGPPHPERQRSPGGTARRHGCVRLHARR